MQSPWTNYPANSPVTKIVKRAIEQFAFWSSQRARSMLENTAQIARTTYQNEIDRVAINTLTAASDTADYLRRYAIDDPRLWAGFARNQVLNRSLSEAIIFTYGRDKQIRALLLVDPYDRPLTNDIAPSAIEQLSRTKVVPIESSNRIGAITKLDYGPDTYLYEARVFDPQFRQQIQQSNAVLKDYRSLLNKARLNQLRFNAALLLG